MPSSRGPGFPPCTRPRRGGARSAGFPFGASARTRRRRGAPLSSRGRARSRTDSSRSRSGSTSSPDGGLGYSARLRESCRGSLGWPQDLRDLFDRIPPDVRQEALEPQVRAPRSVRTFDHDPSDAFDRPREMGTDDGPDDVGVPRVAIDLPVLPLLGVRLEESAKQVSAFSESRQPFQDRGIDLVQEFLLGRQDHLLALEFRAGEGLDPRPLRGFAGLLLPLGAELRSLRPRVREDPLSLGHRRTADLLGLGASLCEDVLDHLFESHVDRGRDYATLPSNWSAITRPKTTIVSGSTIRIRPRPNNSGFSAIAPTVAPPTTFSAHAVANPVPAMVIAAEIAAIGSGIVSIPPASFLHQKVGTAFRCL